MKASLFAAVVALAVAATTFGQTVKLALPLAGFRYVRLLPPQGRDGSVDPFGLAPYLEDLLAKQGWSILRGSEDLFKPESREMASQTIRCGIGIDHAGFGTKAFLRCEDVIGHERENRAMLLVADSSDVLLRLFESYDPPVVEKWIDTTATQYSRSPTVPIDAEVALNPTVEPVTISSARIPGSSSVRSVDCRG